MDQLLISFLDLLFVDLIAIPDFAAGAMENWGLVTYRESAVLYHPGESSDSDRQLVALVIAHELAHQVNKTNLYKIVGYRQQQAAALYYMMYCRLGGKKNLSDIRSSKTSTFGGPT